MTESDIYSGAAAIGLMLLLVALLFATECREQSYVHYLVGVVAPYLIDMRRDLQSLLYLSLSDIFFSFLFLRFIRSFLTTLLLSVEKSTQPVPRLVQSGSSLCSVIITKVVYIFFFIFFFSHSIIITNLYFIYKEINLFSHFVL